MGSMNTVTDMMGLGYLDDGQTEAYLKDMGMTGPGVYLGDGQTEAYLKGMGMTGSAQSRLIYFHIQNKCSHNFASCCPDTLTCRISATAAAPFADLASKTNCSRGFTTAFSDMMIMFVLI